MFACYIVVFEGGVQGYLRDLHTVPGRFLDDGRGHENIGYVLGGTMAVRLGYCMYVWLCFTTAGVEMRFRGVLCW